MMLRTTVLSLGLVASVVLGESRATAQPAPPDAAAVRLVVTGTIRNFSEVAALIVPDSYVQLVPLAEDGSYGFDTDEKGRFAYSSDLPKVPAPAKAAFSFAFASAPPGRYLLAMQRLKAQPEMAGQRPWFEKDKRKPFIVEIPASAKGVLEIEAGKLVVWTR
jgi:hypothetical protein